MFVVVIIKILVRDLSHYQSYNYLQIKKVPQKESVYGQKNISLKVDNTYLYLFYSKPFTSFPNIASLRDIMDYRPIVPML